MLARTTRSAEVHSIIITRYVNVWLGTCIYHEEKSLYYALTYDGIKPLPLHKSINLCGKEYDDNVPAILSLHIVLTQEHFLYGLREILKPWHVLSLSSYLYWYTIIILHAHLHHCIPLNL